MAHMNTENIDNKEDQYVWNMATDAVLIGGRLKVIGSVLSVLSVVSGISLALVCMFAIKGDYAATGVVMSLVGIVPAFAMGQFLCLPFFNISGFSRPTLFPNSFGLGFRLFKSVLALSATTKFQIEFGLSGVRCFS